MTSKIMTQMKNKQVWYAGIGIALAFVVCVLSVFTVFAESREHFKKGTYSPETKGAIYAALESGDYAAYTTAVAERNRQPKLTQEEFARQAEKVAKRQQIQDAFTAGDYATYTQLTNGSIHQLSEPAFNKRSTMTALKEELKAALTDRDYTLYVQKREELKALLGDEYVDHGRRGGSGEEITEERFNALADKVEQYGEMGRARFGKEGKGRDHRSDHRRGY